MLLISSSHAQFSAEATVMSMYDDNVNNSYLHIADKITELSFKAGYDWENEQSNTQVFYLGALDYFGAITDRTFHTHSFGATYSNQFDEENETLFNTGATYGVRVGRGDYTLYDFRQLSAYANIKHYLAERVMGKASYSFRSVTFPELADFDYSEHYGFLQGTFFLPTNTTLILEADLGTKIYSTPNYDSTTQSGSQGSGYGRRRIGSASTPSVTQLIGLARVGQSIVEGTGLSLTSSYQLNVQKESRYLTSDYGTISDDELFDDHYGYEGLRTSLMLTQLLPADIRVRITGSLQNRSYTERPAYDVDGNQVAATREDTRKIVTIQFDKQFEALGISLGISYDYIVNRSNDLFYNYTNNALTARVAIAY
jgi:hypothetical protein